MAQTRIREVDGKQVKCFASTIYVAESADDAARKLAYQRKISKSAIFVEILEKALMPKKATEGAA